MTAAERDLYRAALRFYAEGYWPVTGGCQRGPDAAVLDHGDSARETLIIGLDSAPPPKRTAAPTKQEASEDPRRQPEAEEPPHKETK